MEYKKLDLGGKKLYQHNFYFRGKEVNNDYVLVVNFVNENPLAINNTLQPLQEFLVNNGFTNSSSPYQVSGVFENYGVIVGIYYSSNNFRALCVNTASSVSTYSFNDFNFVYDTVFQLN